MHVALIGATGAVGTRLLSELLSRGHTVTGIARTPDALAPRDGLSVRTGDAGDRQGLPALLAGHDAVIAATKFLTTDHRALIEAVKAAGVPRLLVVGGAGSLEVAPGKALIDTPEFPAAYHAEASAGRDVLTLLRGERELDWSFLSPSALLLPGTRTGVFRLGGDSLLIDAEGKSHISIEDFAIALIDELDTPKHSRQRFTVGY